MVERATSLFSHRARFPGISLTSASRAPACRRAPSRQKHLVDQLRSRFDNCVRSREVDERAQHRQCFNRIDCCACASSLRSSNCSRQRCGGLPRFTPEFERTNLGETGSEAHYQVHVAFLAIPQQGHQRRDDDVPPTASSTAHFARAHRAVYANCKA